jgi:hypothetical protein
LLPGCYLPTAGKNAETNKKAVGVERTHGWNFGPKQKDLTDHTMHHRR